MWDGFENRYMPVKNGKVSTLKNIQLKNAVLRQLSLENSKKEGLFFAVFERCIPVTPDYF
jgi:hypothetical protein